MIPSGSTVLDRPVRQLERPSRTWKLDLASGRIRGFIDGLEAVKQAAFKILQTQRYRYLIYSFDYGHELESLIGMNPLFVKSELTRITQEALLQDDRIQGIENMEVAIAGDSISADFTVNTVYGSFGIIQEVR